MRRLSDREYAALLDAKAGRLYRRVSTSRYAIRVDGRKDWHGVTFAARQLAAAGLLWFGPPVRGRAGGRVVWQQAEPSPVGLLAIEREGLEREVEGVPT
jgi:hypothetical protein